MNEYPFNSGYEKSVSGTIDVLNSTAEKGANHMAFREDANKPDYLTMPDKLSALATDLKAAKSQGNTDLVDALMVTSTKALQLNANHIYSLSLFHNDRSILDAGYPFKEKPVAKEKINLLDTLPEAMVKYLYANGAIVTEAALLVVKRAGTNAIIEVQVTETPNDEGSWVRVGEGIYNESRIELRGLPSAKRLYFRVRYHEKGATGHWTVPVSILIH